MTIQYDADNANASLKFYGKGREKMSFINSLVKLKLYNHLEKQLPIAKTKKYPFDYLFNYTDSVGDSMFSKLDSIKSFMNPESYSLLKADVKATVMGNKYRSVGLVYHESVDKTLQVRQNKLTESSKQYLQHVLNFDETLFYSSSYVNEVYNILYLDYDGRILSKEIDTGLVKKYDYLNSRLPLSLSIPVLTLFIGQDINKLNQTGNVEDLKMVIQSTYKNLQDSSFKNYIERRFKDVTSFKKGMDTPGFVLENEVGEKVSLNSFKGKVIYLDFWYAACGPCHALFKILKPLKKIYSQKKLC